MAMKKKAPAKKKAPIDYPEGASGRSKKAASKRMEAQAQNIRWSRNDAKNAASRRATEQADSMQNWVERSEGGDFVSSAVIRKNYQAMAREKAERLKAASQQMKQGVTKSGGYSKDMFTRGSLRDLRSRPSTKSAKFKADQAVKKSGGSLTRNTKNKKKNAK
jgi:hypothetical protein